MGIGAFIGGCDGGGGGSLLFSGRRGATGAGLDSSIFSFSGSLPPLRPRWTEPHSAPIPIRVRRGGGGGGLSEVGELGSELLTEVIGGI